MEKLRNLYKKNPHGVIFAGVVFVLIALVTFFVIRSITKPEPTIRPDQIQVRRGDRVVTVNENGLVEYRSDEGVFYETWDPNRTSAFFTTIRAQAREYLANPPKEIPPNAFEVMLWIDGELVTIYIEGDDDLLEEVFEEFDESEGDGDLSDYFDTLTPTLQPTLPPGVTATPTLPPGVTATPTPILGSGGGSGGGGQSPADCDLYNTQVTQRTVISNTICQTEEQ